MGKVTVLDPNAKAIYDLYENGKGRRYGLLFGVNGGAYALVGLLIGKDARLDALTWSPLTVWAFVLIPIAMIVYTWLMYQDILAFGMKMRRYAQELERDPDIFGPAGVAHLRYVCLLFAVAWAMAAVLACVEMS